MKINYILIIIISLSLSACGVQKKTTNATDVSSDNVERTLEVVEGCNAIGTIRDFRNEGTCQYLIELDNGTKLLPVILPPTEVPFYEKAGVKVGYKKVGKENDVFTGINCSKHDMAVEITCIEEYVKLEDGVPAKHQDCKPIKNPYQSKWILRELSVVKPNKIKEYNYEIGYLYEFINSQESILYDCLGYRMCSTTEMGQDCASLIESLKDGKLILVTDNKE